MIVKIFEELSSPVLSAIFLAKAVIVQNKNKMVKALQIPFMALIIRAAPCSSEKSVKNLPIRLKRGAPGGCPTSNL